MWSYSDSSDHRQKEKFHETRGLLDRYCSIKFSCFFKQIVEVKVSVPGHRRGEEGGGESGRLLSLGTCTGQTGRSHHGLRGFSVKVVPRQPKAAGSVAGLARIRHRVVRRVESPLKS